MLVPRFLTAMLFAVIISFSSISTASTATEPIELDQRPASESEWGYRPAPGSSSETNPPAFSWRPQKGIVSWQVEARQCDPDGGEKYLAENITFNVHCPARTLAPGKYVWRYRGVDKDGRKTEWSIERKFTIPADATKMPMPKRSELLVRIPKSHPRLFLRPEDLPRIKELAAGSMRSEFEKLENQCKSILKNPPPTKEPQKYPKGTVRLSEEWRKIWWGNRVYTVSALGNAATLGFVWQINGDEKCGQLAKKILLDCAKWDPKGSTGYRYNDEAGMPYAYHFSRTYTFIHDLLSEEERKTCRRVMKIRGDEMYHHLYPRHLWRPYASHSNRAWHFLGEVGIAFKDEIDGADDWIWFAANVFHNVYPVWSDSDGGWHEGMAYWSSYLTRFTLWADVMRASMGINAYQKPFFSNAGYYSMYLMPPGKQGGGFGDLTAHRKASHNVTLVSQFAGQSGNGHWQWYVEQLGGPGQMSGYIGFLRGALPNVQPTVPDDLPSSRVFRGIGQAYLNSNLKDAADGVQIVFKSSPFGTQSHGYEANNSFLLWAYGQRLLIRTGLRDVYGSKHHKEWMWSTRSVNNITVINDDEKGEAELGQARRTAVAKGQIVDFHTTPAIDVVVGEAGSAYSYTGYISKKPGPLNRFTRAIIFVKPDLVIVYDRLAATKESRFRYRLHAVNRFDAENQQAISLSVKDVGCKISILHPDGLELSQTDQYDPNPRPRVKLREWHLSADTTSPAEKMEFVTLIRPYRIDAKVAKPKDANLKSVDDGYVLTAKVPAGTVTALLPNNDGGSLRAEGLETDNRIAVRLCREDGSEVETVHAKMKME
ncbi:MAG: DUF4962 domain-containing protein [Pirellulales bacterium]|nr:DUF4962 domain-containing protein [Pirellulales bacterium]